MSTDERTATEAELRELVDELLARDRRAHEAALAELASVGDERVVPHLIDVVMVDAIANDWERFGFPEVLRDGEPPRYLALPEVAWPGIVETLGAIAEPSFDSPHAWVEWESWYSQQDIEPLPGYDEWKRRFFRSFAPPVGGLLDAEPMGYPLSEVRYGNTDRSYLAALNFPAFVPGEAVDADTAGASDHERYLEADQVVYGFELSGQAYAVPRMVLFPHEFMNATLQGQPVMLAWCTLCNAPILYDRRVDGEALTFGNTGLLWQGNKIMYDEATESLWAHHSGRAKAGHYYEREATLDVLPCAQTKWGEWFEANPDTLVPHLETGYGYDYTHYADTVGFFHHYWENEGITQPGVKRVDGALPEKESVYGVVSEADPDAIHIYPLDAVETNEPVVDTIDDRDVVVVTGVAGDDVAVYAAPPLPVEREGDELVDGEGTRWAITRDGLTDNGVTLERITGRHGLWFAFRIQYETHHVVTS